MRVKEYGLTNSIGRVAKARLLFLIALNIGACTTGPYEKVSAESGIETEVLTQYCKVLRCKYEGTPTRFTAKGTDRDRNVERGINRRLRKIEFTYVQSLSEIAVKVINVSSNRYFFDKAIIHADGKPLQEIVGKRHVEIIGPQKYRDESKINVGNANAAAQHRVSRPVLGESLTGSISIEKARVIAEAEKVTITFYTNKGRFERTVHPRHNLLAVVELAELFAEPKN